MPDPDRADIRERPLYSQREAAFVVGVSPSVLRRWLGPTGEGPLIRVADPESRRLSFNNVIEAYVLRSLQTRHGVSSRAVRRAVVFAEGKLGVERLLLRKELRWSGDLFWDQLSDLVNLSESGQLAMRQVVESYLNRVDWDAADLPARLFPRVVSAPEARNVVVDPRLGFGQPVVAGVGVGTSVVARRIDAGETVEDVARDYGVGVAAIADAVVYQAGV